MWTLQGLLQLETLLHESDSVNWTAAAAFSSNRNDSFDSGHFSPAIVPSTGFQDSWTRSGFLKLSTNVSGTSGPTFWNTNAYFSDCSCLFEHFFLWSMGFKFASNDDVRAG